MSRTGSTPYRFKADRTPFLLCTECDSLWWPDDTVGVAQAHFLDDVVAERLGLEGNPWSDRVWADVIEPAPDARRCNAPHHKRTR